MSFAFYLLTPLLPLYLTDRFGASKDMIGLVLSGYTITALLVRPFSGFLVDSFPRKRVLLISLFFYFICFSGYLAAGTLLLFAIVRTMHGAPFGACTVANSTMAIDVLPSSRRNEGIGYYGLSNNVATAIAPTVGIFLYRYTANFELLFWLAFLVAGVGFLADYTIKTPQKPVQTAKLTWSFDRFFLLKGWAIGVNMAFFGLCYGVLSNYLAIYGKEMLNITGGTGTYFMLLAIGLIVSRIQGGRMLRKGRLTHNAAEGIIISTIGYTLFVACPNSQNMIIAMAQNNQRGTANSTILTSWDLGMGLGVLLGGAIVEYADYSTAFWWIAVMHVLGALFFFLITRRQFQKGKIQ